MCVTMTLILVLLCAGIVTWAQPGGEQDSPPTEVEAELEAAMKANGRARPESGVRDVVG